MSDRIRVAMVAACPFPAPRGSPVRIERMAQALTSEGVEVDVVTYGLGDPDTTRQYGLHRTRRLPAYRTTAPGPTWQKLLLLDPMLVGTLSRLLATERFDLIHAHHYEGLLVALAARRGRQIPIFFDAHTLLESELPSYLPPWLAAPTRWIGRWLDLRLPARADGLVAVSEEIAQRLVRDAGVPADRARIVATGVEAQSFEVGPRDRSGDAGAGPVIVYAGGLAPFHGIDLLLRSFRDVVRAQPEASLWILTRSSFDGHEPLAQSLGVRERVKVVASGFEALPGLLAQADVAVNPRVDCTGVPQKLLNYMAAGLPIVSFEGSAKMLAHGRSAWLVQDGNVPAFAEGVLRVLADQELAVRLGSAARSQILAEHRWEDSARQLIAFYREVLAG